MLPTLHIFRGAWSWWCVLVVGLHTQLHSKHWSWSVLSCSFKHWEKEMDICGYLWISMNIWWCLKFSEENHRNVTGLWHILTRRTSSGSLRQYSENALLTHDIFQRPWKDSHIMSDNIPIYGYEINQALKHHYCIPWVFHGFSMYSEPHQPSTTPFRTASKSLHALQARPLKAEQWINDTLASCF